MQQLTSPFQVDHSMVIMKYNSFILVWLCLVFASLQTFAQITPPIPTPASIGAVIALERFPVGQREFNILLARKERKAGRRLRWDDRERD